RCGRWFADRLRKGHRALQIFTYADQSLWGDRRRRLILHCMSSERSLSVQRFSERFYAFTQFDEQITRNAGPRFHPDRSLHRFLLASSSCLIISLIALR